MGPLESVRIGEAPDRKGRREPDHEREMHCGYAAGLGASRVREAPRSVPVLVIMMRMPAGFAVVAVPMLMAVIAVPMVVPVMVPVDLPVLVRRVVMSMAVLVGMAVAAVVMAAIVVVGAALGLERALHER